MSDALVELLRKPTTRYKWSCIQSSTGVCYTANLTYRFGHNTWSSLITIKHAYREAKIGWLGLDMYDVDIA